MRQRIHDLWGAFQPALAGAVLLLFTACGEPQKTVLALEPTDATVCALDGMLLTDFPGPKAQIHYDTGDPDFFCDTMEMLSIYLRPEQQKRVTAVYTQDMAQTDWNKPSGHWIDARAAFYVLGSDMKGSMGPTAASFARAEDAQAFAKAHGGKVLRFDEITPAMVSLDGGVLHDQNM